MRSSSAITISASSTSCCWIASRVRSSVFATMSSPPSACSSSCCSSSWKWSRCRARRHQPTLPGDVGLRARVGRVREDLLGVVVLDHPAGAVRLVRVELDGEERGHVRHARRLLHVVRDDHDRVVLAQLHHQVLDPAGRDRVERRARLVHQDHVGLDREAARDAQPLLLAAGHAERVRLEPVLHLVPERAAAQRPSRRSRPCRPSSRARAGRTRCCRRSTSGTGSASGTPSRSACAPATGSTCGP